MYLLYYRNIQYVEQDGELYYLVKNAQRKIKPPQNKRFIEFYYCPIMCISQQLVSKLNDWLAAKSKQRK